LFAYTDGLVDARSPGDVSYGLDPLKQYLLGLDPTTIQAQDVLDHVVQAVRQHIAEADQFDDLTLMSFHLK
jgi:sigma-B regulation protein RsbU (phosphoserine phosphatase)